MSTPIRGTRLSYGVPGSKPETRILPMTPTDIPTGDARLALAEALAEYPAFTLPDPLRLCDRCHQHAAFYRDDDAGDDERVRYFCGVCAPAVSVFRLPMPPDDLRQVAADEALHEAA